MLLLLWPIVQHNRIHWSTFHYAYELLVVSLKYHVFFFVHVHLVILRVFQYRGKMVDTLLTHSLLGLVKLQLLNNIDKILNARSVYDLLFLVNSAIKEANVTAALESFCYDMSFINLSCLIGSNKLNKLFWKYSK